MNVLLKLHFKNGTILEIDKVVTFCCSKERYTPYSTLTVTAETECSDAAIVKIDFSVEGKLVHSGIMDSLSVVKSEGRSLLKITSRSFSSMLAQNEIAPGTLTAMSLNKLMSQYMIIPNVTWQSSDATVRYIYVKEHDSQWTAVTCLGLSLHETYPYIGAVNEIRLTPADNPLVVTPQKIFEEGIRGDYSRMVSNYHMKDVNGSYSYHYTDGFAEERGIIRHKYIPYDRQYIALDDLGLQFKLNFTERGSNAYFVSYLGYDGEEIRDKVMLSDGAVREISAIDICGSAKRGIFTKLICYFDRYCNI
mgnify:FL=1